MKELEDALLPFKGSPHMTIPALQAVHEELGYLPKNIQVETGLFKKK